MSNFGLLSVSTLKSSGRCFTGWCSRSEYLWLICNSHICLKHRWKPKFEAKPIDPAEAERLQRRRERRERRPLCTCTLLQQASVNL